MQKTAVLFIDDQTENIEAFASLLDTTRLQLIRAESTIEALQKIEKYRFAFIVINSGMAGMQDHEIAFSLRGASGAATVPLLFLTATRQDHEQSGHPDDLGYVDYLAMPLCAQPLKAKVDFFLELYRLRQLVDEQGRQLDAKCLELEVLYQELEEKNAKLERLSSLDGLTGLFNRRYFDDNLLKEWRQASRNDGQLAVLIVDLDNFKGYNEYYGHLAGDDCLRKVGQSLYEALMRPADIIARYGGEEFAALLPDTAAEGAEEVASRMMGQVAQLAIEHQESPTAGVLTVSIGASTCSPNESVSPASLLLVAERALAVAKQKGRNTFHMQPAGC